MSKYEGIDARVIESFVNINVTLGDFVVSNSDLVLNLLLDALFRQLGMLHTVN